MGKTSLSVGNSFYTCETCKEGKIDLSGKSQKYRQNKKQCFKSDDWPVLK